MPKSLRIGDVVQLNSGGPKMTVRDTNRDHGLVPCDWFDKDMKAHRESFPAESLTKVEPGDPTAQAPAVL